MPAEQVIPIIDGHNDTVLDLYNNGKASRRSFFEESGYGHIDLPRARRGGLGGGFFALFTPARSGRPATSSADGSAPERDRMAPVSHADALEFTLGMAAFLFRLARESNGDVAIVRTVDELERCLADGTLAVIFHIEGAEAIDTDLNALEVLYQAGLRSIGITWSRANRFASGVPFAFPSSPDTGPGLTDAGKDLVRACQEMGIVVDLSHLNQKGFWDVARLSGNPLVASHSCAHAVSPVSRNLTDAQLDAVRDSGGVVGVNYHVGFLRPDGEVDSNTPLETIVRHVDYMVDRMGIEHVALGSDFDGATMPAELGDVAGLPKLMDTLRDAGYDDDALRKIAHENWLRVLRDTWKD
jgi:membrane dipeptidase